MSAAGPLEPSVQSFEADGRQIALLVRAGYRPGETEFLTPHDYKQQLGFVVAPEGRLVLPHTHRETERRIAGMSELLVVREGRCLVDLYGTAKTPVATVELRAGDLLLIVGGGHGVRVLEDTVILEVKQGPFAGPDDKILLHNTR